MLETLSNFGNRTVEFKFYPPVFQYNYFEHNRWWKATSIKDIRVMP